MIAYLILIARMAGAVDVCVDGFEVKPTKTHEVPNGVSYFIRPVPATREISFGSLDEKTPSQVLNVDTGRMSPVDGSVDPVLTPDGAVLTIPQGVLYDGQTKKTRIVAKDEDLKPKYAYMNGEVLECEKDKCENTSKLSKDDLIREGKDYVFSAMTFYARDSSGGFKFIHADENQNMNYQSLATLDVGADQRRYRMLFKQDQIAFQDFTYDPVHQKIDMLGARHTVCPEVAGGDMPMLSKDGRSLSAYDETQKAVMVYQVNDQGKCTLQDRLPSMTGKVDFSPDGKLLAFALDGAVAPGETGSREYERPTANQRLRAYVYDRETKRLTQIDREVGGQTYFPVFLSNDEVGYIHAAEDPADTKMQIKVIKLSRKDTVPSTCTGCRANAKLRQAGALLAMMYAKKCNPLQFGFSDTSRILGWLSPFTCDRFVRTITPAALTRAKVKTYPAAGWMPLVIKTVSLKDLSSVCQNLTVPKIMPEGVHTAR